MELIGCRWCDSGSGRVLRGPRRSARHAAPPQPTLRSSPNSFIRAVIALKALCSKYKPFFGPPFLAPVGRPHRHGDMVEILPDTTAIAVERERKRLVFFNTPPEWRGDMVGRVRRFAVVLSRCHRSDSPVLPRGSGLTPFPQTPDCVKSLGWSPIPHAVMEGYLHSSLFLRANGTRCQHYCVTRT
ncbi:hypothetical protein JZ751_026003 [Albula glossodonta]|uniref:Uncharacterized protein n=1 Tax=Albula glossodonta TaxID=121402 RepID=A0A8T2MW71_9TELE|nr:hypothetical protein JZ751_026003 [Albula glossodonta]